MLDPGKEERRGGGQQEGEVRHCPINEAPLTSKHQTTLPIDGESA